MFSFIWMLVIGLIVGAVAKLIMPGRDSGGILATMLLGMAGSVVGGFMGRMLGWYAQGQRAGFFMSTLGAILLVWLYRVISHRHSSVEPRHHRAA